MDHKTGSESEMVEGYARLMDNMESKMRVMASSITQYQRLIGRLEGRLDMIQNYSDAITDKATVEYLDGFGDLAENIRELCIIGKKDIDITFKG